MLFLLREEGAFKGKMVGVDYSEHSVMLCRKLAQNRDLGKSDGLQAVNFEVWDVMGNEPLEGSCSFDVVLDKGTFDAVSLSQQTDIRGRRLCEGYKDRVEDLVKEGGKLLVTSCNWTEAELKRWFRGGSLEAVGRIEYPVFSFGGQTGQSVCSVCFQKGKND